MGKTQFALAGLVLTLGFAPAAGWAQDSTGSASTAISASATEVMAKVREAAQYLKEKGLAGFADFNNNRTPAGCGKTAMCSSIAAATT